MINIIKGKKGEKILLTALWQCAQALVCILMNKLIRNSCFQATIIVWKTT